MERRIRISLLVTLAVLAAALSVPGAMARDGQAEAGAGRPFPAAGSLHTTTPIKHLVVIVPENQSFDHYFGTYPKAENLPGEVRFKAKPGTPDVNGLTRRLRTHNPNLVNPYRLPPKRILSCDPDHFMDAQEAAIDEGAMDRFVQASSSQDGCPGHAKWAMSYFDGNTITAQWNYAQRFAMSDAFHADVLGPSTPGHLNLIAGQTHGADPANAASGGVPYTIRGTTVDDPDPAGDDCSGSPQISMSGRNIGDLLSSKHVSWGYFQGGFAPTDRTHGQAVCGAEHKNAIGITPDYVPHHEPFQYYEQTANPRHRRPTAPSMIGSTDRANHQYDLRDFWKAAKKGHQPAVSFLKPPAWADAHAGYSNPLAEQRWLVKKMNHLQRLDTWKHTAILIVYDDSGGWYDHVEPPLRSESAIPGFDSLTGPGRCGDPSPSEYQGRCGLGMRIPFIVVSPYARSNHVDHHLLQQSSVLRFIEDNWKLGRLGNQSFDAEAESIEPLFNWKRHTHRLFLRVHSGAPVK
jgi:phospholipase C